MTSARPSNTDIVPGACDPKSVDPEALMVALILAPHSFSRNRFFQLFESAPLRSARRRAKLVRSLVKELTEPWPHPGEIPAHPPAAIEEREERDGQIHLVFRVDGFGYRRHTILTPTESAALHYALSRSGLYEVSAEERRLVEQSLARLSPLTQEVQL